MYPTHRCLLHGQCTAAAGKWRCKYAGVSAQWAASRLFSTKHYYEPRNGHGLKYDPFNSIVAPRPIGWIGSISEEGGHNLAPYSFFTAFNYHPPIIGFSSIGYKDTLANINATGNFSWNLATLSLATAMNASADPVSATVDEFQHAGLTPAPSRLITSPRVRESPVSFECEVTQVVQLQGSVSKGKDKGKVNCKEKDGVTLLETWLVLGEVVGVHIDREVISEEGVFSTMAAQPIMRGGGAGDYFWLNPENAFQMKRGVPSPLA